VLNDDDDDDDDFLIARPCKCTVLHLAAGVPDSTVTTSPLPFSLPLTVALFQSAQASG